MLFTNESFWGIAQFCFLGHFDFWAKFFLRYFDLKICSFFTSFGRCPKTDNLIFGRFSPFSRSKLLKKSPKISQKKIGIFFLGQFDFWQFFFLRYFVVKNDLFFRPFGRWDKTDSFTFWAMLDFQSPKSTKKLKQLENNRPKCLKKKKLECFWVILKVGNGLKSNIMTVEVILEVTLLQNID